VRREEHYWSPPTTALPLMFATGLWLEGRLFAVEIRQPLVALAALADLGVGLPALLARTLGAGAGRVVAWTYEYGNAFLIVAGLLMLALIATAICGRTNELDDDPPTELLVGDMPEVRRDK